MSSDLTGLARSHEPSGWVSSTVTQWRHRSTLRIHPQFAFHFDTPMPGRWRRFWTWFLTGWTWEPGPDADK